MTSVPLKNNSNNHAEADETQDELGPLDQDEQDLEDIWRDSWSDEENDGDAKKKRQLRAVCP